MLLAFFFGAFGAIVAEVLKRWQQWNELPEERFRALFKSLKFWSIAVFLVLLGGTVGCFEGTKTNPIDWSLCFFVGIGAMSTVRNFLSGLAAQEPRNSKTTKRKMEPLIDKVSPGDAERIPILLEELESQWAAEKRSKGGKEEQIEAEPTERLETKDQEVLKVKRTRRLKKPAIERNLETEVEMPFPQVQRATEPDGSKIFVSYTYDESSPPHDVTFRELFN
jgi:hypothetical protein